MQLLELMPNFDCFITKKIEPANCVGYLYVADHYGLSATKRKAERVMLNKLSEVCKLEEFSQLTFSEMVDVVMKSMERKMKCDDLLQACVTWVLAEEEDRKKYFADFLHQITLDSCSPQFLKSLLDSYNETLLDDKGLYHQVNTALLGELNLSPPGPQGKNIMILGGQDAKNKIVNRMWKLNDATGKCEEVMTHTFRYHPAICVTSLGVLVAGGRTRSRANSSVEDCDLFHLKTLK